MPPNSDDNIDELLDQFHTQSPLPLFIALLVGALWLALAINFFSSATYDLLVLSLSLNPGDVAWTLHFALDLFLMLCTGGMILLAGGYLYQLGARQQPRVRRVLTLVLPFVRRDGKMRFQEQLLDKIQAYRGMGDILNWAVEKGDKSPARREWHQNWQWPVQGSESPLRNDAVTILYDFVEWMIIREIADYGEHLYAGKGNLRPGDDLYEWPLEVQRPLREDLYSQGRRANYLWAHSNKADEQKLKMPTATTLRWQALPRRFGVERFSGEAVHQLIIRNPAGRLTITPSQIWRKATRQQARSLLAKQMPPNSELYPLEMQVAVEVQLSQWPFVWPWSLRHMEAYQRWLFELQAQLVRHMDWDRYVAYDYQRMLVEIRDSLRRRGTKGEEGDDAQST